MNAPARRSNTPPLWLTRVRAARVALAALLFCAPAASARVSLQTLGAVSTGVTNDPNPGNEGDLTDSVTEVMPSLLLEIRAGRALHQLQYTFTGTIYAENFGASSYANAVTWGLLNEVTENLRLGVGAGFTQGQLNGFALRQFIVESGGPQARGDTTFIELSATQGLDWAMTPDWSLSQTFAGSLYRPLVTEDPVPDTLSTEASLGVTRSWDKLRLGGRLLGAYVAELAYIDTTIPTPPGTPDAVPPERCELRASGGCDFPIVHLQRVEARAEGGIDLARMWSLELAAGALEAAEIGGSGAVYVQPTALATLSFEGLRANASLTFEHTFDVSVQLGQTFRIERVRFNAEVPVGVYFHEQWFLVAAAGYDYARQIILHHASPELGADAHVFLAEAGVEYRPSELFSAGLRYELTGQTEVADPMGEDPLPGFARHALMARVEFRYPGSRRDRLRITRRSVQPHRVSPEQWRRFFAPTEAEEGTRRPSGQ